MKKIINHKKFPEWFTVTTLSVMVAIINIIHVIIGFAKTPIDFTYLATGHYYLDYFQYLQHIAIGIDSRWMPMNYFTTESSLVDWRFFPYILLGKVAWIFHLSPMLAYWMSVFFLTVFTLIGFYFIIDLMLNKHAFYIKIIAFLFAVFSGPVYKILVNNGQLIFNPYDFWYGPATFIRRFEVVPYHALGLFLLILIIITINKIWEKIPDLSKKTILLKSFWVTALLIILMTFSPLALASLIPALLIVSAIRFIKSKRDRFKIFLLNLIILIFIIPVALILRNNAGYSGWNIEVNWIGYDPWWFFLLNLGPITLFFPFGLRDYLKEKNFTRLILLIFTLVSFGLYMSPIAYYLGIHNLRFFSSISYICYGVLTVLGIKKMSSLFNRYPKIIIISISFLLIFYSCLLTMHSLYNRASGLDASNPETVWTYLPNSIIKGLQSLHRYPQANVLTGPYGGIGMFVPIFSYRRVYIGHPSPILMPNIEEKRAIAYLFYSGIMTEKEANKFLKTNKIEFVIVTSYDNFDVNVINRYSFLKPIFVKGSIIIWKVIN